MVLIVLEGLSCVGKTTLAPRLAAQVGAEFVPSIPPELAAARRAVDAQRDVEARHLFYLTALAVTSATIRPRIDAGGKILLESYLDRAQAFHLGMGSAVSVDVHFLVQPDVVIILECDESVRRRRVSERSLPKSSYWRERSERCVEQIRLYYDAHPFAEHVDSSSSIETLLNSAVQLVRKYDDFAER